MEQLNNISDYPVKSVLKLILSDKSTKQNIVFATSSYAYLGNRYADALPYVKECKLQELLETLYGDEED